MRIVDVRNYERRRANNELQSFFPLSINLLFELPEVFFFFFSTKKILYCQKRLEEIVGVGGKTPAKLRRHGENHPKSEYWTY